MDSLRDIGQPVSNRQLVLNTLRGLNELFSNVATFLSMQAPFSTFPNTVVAGQAYVGLGWDRRLMRVIRFK